MEKKFYAIRLMDDFAEMIDAALDRRGITQRQLAKMAKYKNESYISRLVNSETNFKIGVVARVLVPLGIIPRLIDQAELERLREIAARQSGSEKPNEQRSKSIAISAYAVTLGPSVQSDGHFVQSRVVTAEGSKTLGTPQIAIAVNANGLG